MAKRMTSTSFWDSTAENVTLPGQKLKLTETLTDLSRNVAGVSTKQACKKPTFSATRPA